ncbi:MAG: transketolase [Candidatus Taylorbacteria bacterium]|nr:transketolase [Candidatus Taylorbacteria bacterium]
MKVHLHEKDLRMLEEKANEIRQTLIEALIGAGSGHSAGPLGMADIFAALFFYILRHDPKNPAWEERDRLVLSNGHICPVLYSAMAHAGYASVEEYKKTLRKFGTKFQGHPHRQYFGAVETSSGPLGSGLSQAVGMALADRMDRGRSSGRFIYALLSDAEEDAGNLWEAAMLAGKEKLGNLIAVVDRNNIQIDGYTEDIMPLEPLRQKWEAFNWHVQEIDGHNFLDIIEHINEAKAVFSKPSVILAHTIPGKGVSFMERDFKWHGTPPGASDMPGEPPKGEQGRLALEELRTLGGRIISEHQ